MPAALPARREFRMTFDGALLDREDEPELVIRQFFWAETEPPKLVRRNGCKKMGDVLKEFTVAGTLSSVVVPFVQYSVD